VVLFLELTMAYMVHLELFLLAPHMVQVLQWLNVLLLFLPEYFADVTERSHSAPMF